MIRRNRVQVPDLPAPDPIRPAPLPSDTYAPPAQPPIDNDLENLARGLGAFSSGLTALVSARAKKAEDERLAQMDAAYNYWRSTRKEDEQLQDIYAGKAPYQTDPYFYKVLSKHYGYLEAKKLGGSLDEEFNSGKIPLGQNDFNVERFLLDRAEPIAQKLSHNREAIASFRQGLDGLRSRAIEKHEQARAYGVAAAVNQVMTDNFRDILDKSVEGQRGGAEALADMRTIIKELGPRLQGGSLGVKYSAGEAALLNVLEQYADNPKYAAVIQEVIGAEREDLAQTGVKLGSFYADAKYGDRARAILFRSRRAQATEAERLFKEAFQHQMDQRFDAEDGTFSVAKAPISDLERPNPFDPTSTMKASAAEAARIAQKRWLDKAVATGVPIEAQVEKFARNGEVHPALKAGLQGSFVAITMPNPKADQAEVTKQFVAAAGLYMTSMRVAPGADLGMSEDQKHLFETYRVLVENGGEPIQIADALRAMYADPARREKMKMTGEDQRKLTDTLNSERYGHWMALGFNVPLTGEKAQNFGALRPQVEQLARAIAVTRMISAEDAVKLAVKSVAERHVYVNGHIIIGVPGFTKELGKMAEQGLKDFFDRHKTELKAYDVYGPDDLTIIPAGPTGRFKIGLRSNGLPVPVLRRAESPEDATYAGARMMTYEMEIGKLRQKYWLEQAQNRKKQIDELTKPPPPSQWSPGAKWQPREQDPPGIEDIGKALKGAGKKIEESAGNPGSSGPGRGPIGTLRDRLKGNMYERGRTKN